VEDKLTPLQIFLSCFSIASLAGLAALLRSGQVLSWRMVFSAFMYSGIFGLTWSLICYRWFGGSAVNLYFLVGSAGLIGLGGASLLDFVVAVIARGGINVTIVPKEPADKVEKK
jgi:hypothetical protein